MIWILADVNRHRHKRVYFMMKTPLTERQHTHADRL